MFIYVCVYVECSGFQVFLSLQRVVYVFGPLKKDVLAWTREEMILKKSTQRIVE